MCVSLIKTNSFVKIETNNSKNHDELTKYGDLHVEFSM